MNDEHRQRAGRRTEDREALQALEDVRALLTSRQRLLARQHRLATERAWLNRVLVFAVFVLAGVTGYGIAHTLPQLRAAQDQQVCAYRAVANREAGLARVDSPRAARARHRQNANTFRALERVASSGRTVRCRRLINKGRRRHPHTRGAP